MSNRMDWDGNTRRSKVIRDFTEDIRAMRARGAAKAPSGEAWELYRIRKNAWLSANRGASGESCREALAKLRAELGLE